MSSEVQAKWMNCETASTSGVSPSLLRSQYSMALTSWLVWASMSFTACASASLNSDTTRDKRSRTAGGNAGTSGIAGSAASAMSHRTSTRTR